MKNLLIFLILMFSTNAQANTDFEGTWIVTERVCFDGIATYTPSDRFQMKGSTIIMDFVENTFKISYISNGQTFFDAGNFGVEKNIITFEGKFGKRQSLFDFSSNTLRIMTSGFGERGSCKVGDFLMNSFSKKQNDSQSSI